MVTHRLAQLNVAHMKAPLDDPVMAEFAAQLEPVNALADAAPGFVWRLQTEEGDATAVRLGDDERLLVNLSVWESLEALRAFVYRGEHAAVMRRRARWFLRGAEPTTVLWWIGAGEIPGVDEAAERLERLRREGPTPEAFDFAHPFPPPAAIAPRETARLRLARPTHDDLDELAAMQADPVVMRTLAGVRSREETRHHLDEMLAHWARHGFGLWLARDRESGGFVGRGGLRRIEIEGTAEVEVAYALRAESWGRGLASELAREACAVAFDRLELEALVCFTQPHNHGSLRVMQKAGFRFERDFVWAGLPHRLFRLRAVDARRARTRAP